jgi:hypothetical protein
MYRTLCTFSKTFTSGILVGMTVTDTIRHVDAAHAKRWVAGVTKYAKRNGYTISNVVLTDI